MKHHTPASRSIVLMLCSVILFALNILLIRGLSLHLPAADGWVATLFRGMVGMAVVCIFFSRHIVTFGRLFTRPLVILRGALGGISILAFYVTIVHLGAARATIINLSYPMFGSLIAAICLGEHLSTRAWIWMGAGFAGLVVFLGGDLHAGFNRYDLLALAGAIGAGAIVVIIRQLRHTEHTATIYAAQCIYSVLFAAAPAAHATGSLPVLGMAALVIAAIVAAIGQLAMTHAYRELSVARGSAIQMLLPIITAAGGFMFFGERFNFVEIAGAAATLFATWQVVLAPEKTASVHKPAGNPLQEP
jgi:drug/metabolite transporter (DMT)-like permease